MVDPQDGTEAANSAEDRLAATITSQDAAQPDTEAQSHGGRLGPGALTLVVIVAAIILAVVLYGLNSPAPAAQNGQLSGASLTPAAAAGPDGRG